jgi:hypothetical protein
MFSWMRYKVNLLGFGGCSRTRHLFGKQPEIERLRNTYGGRQLVKMCSIVEFCTNYLLLYFDFIRARTLSNLPNSMYSERRETTQKRLGSS